MIRDQARGGFFGRFNNRDRVYAELRRSVGPQADDDHAFLTAPVVPHKALVRMRLARSGDLYVPVPNPLRWP